MAIKFHAAPPGNLQGFHKCLDVFLVNLGNNLSIYGLYFLLWFQWLAGAEQPSPIKIEDVNIEKLWK